MSKEAWSTDVYEERMRLKSKTGKKIFDYDDSIRKLPVNEWKAHPTLDPKGVRTRECRDSKENPEALAIAILFDVTGSMLRVPRIMQTKLKELNSLLVRKGYVDYPQIMFGAIGDATCDRIPLQIGQFESDNRMDENLEKIVLEGGGGGQKTESYELAMYFMAHHTDIDCWNKRLHKGYLFIIGDEMAYDNVKKREVSQVIGDVLQSDITTASIVAELKKRYETFYILPGESSYVGDSQVLGFWKRLLGQNVIELDKPEAVCETIALHIGLCEGKIDLNDGEKDLKELGADKATILAVKKALAGRSNLPVKSSASLPGLVDKQTSNSKVKRL